MSIGPRYNVRLLIPQPLPWRRCLLLTLLGGLTLSTLGGCQRALFPKKADTTQFDSYDRRRYRLPPSTVLDPFGHEQPNLRERLRPDR